jgi:hypothetical protein
VETLIIGAGSIGLKHGEVLRDLEHNVTFLTKRKDLDFRSINDFGDLSKFEYIIIANETSKHISTLNRISISSHTSKILVENPLHFLKVDINDMNKFNFTQNIFIGYQLRFRSAVTKLVEEIEGEKIIYIDLNCASYLPDWNPERDYRETYSAKNNLGGGVLRDVSHEIDLLYYLSKSYELSIDFLAKHKISNLEIENEDYFFCTGKISDVVFKINLDYISRISKRTITLYTENNSYDLDFINNTLRISGSKNNEFFRFDDQNLDAIRLMHEDILMGKGKACSLEEGARVTNWFPMQ